MVLAGVLMLAGCGGGGERGGEEPAGQLVAGSGFTFRAPDGWGVTVTAREAVVKRDEATLVSVTLLPLVKPYRPELFQRVVAELDRVAARLAGRLNGAVASRRTTLAAGGRVRQYDLTHAELVDRLTFVLRGKREFLLTCRWRERDGEPPACAQLVSTFSFR